MASCSPGRRWNHVAVVHLGISCSVHPLGGKFPSVHYTPSFYTTLRRLCLSLERQRNLILKCSEILVCWDHQRFEEQHAFSSLQFFHRASCKLRISFCGPTETSASESCWGRFILSDIDGCSCLQSEKHGKLPFPCKCEKVFFSAGYHLAFSVAEKVRQDSWIEGRAGRLQKP